MTNYARLYQFGITPWENYGKAAAGSIAALLDREEAERFRRPGRALDLGCGRGQHTLELARRGWDAVGIDNVPAAIEAARAKAVPAREGGPGAAFVVGDVTDLQPERLGTFDFFLDIGCFQGFDLAQRVATARGVTALASPAATLLMLAFGPTRLRFLTEGVAREDIEAAFSHWDLLSAETAETAGLGWPMNQTSPHWYRFRLAS